ncbi:MAG: 4a-hydroxytetrahydrobiopterin dehydratase [Ilumatobacteraceae bacterium]
MEAGWVERENTLYRKFELADFTEAFAFMTKVAEIAERLDHHPDWSQSWNVVEITLSSHDKGRTVTSRDHDLAKEINRVFAQFADD